MTRWQDLTDQQQHQARRLLTDKQLQALLLHDNGLSYTDISRFLRIHRNAAISRVKAARHHLKQITQEAA